MYGNFAGDVNFTNEHGIRRHHAIGATTNSLSCSYGYIAKVGWGHDFEGQTNQTQQPLDYTWQWAFYVDSRGSTTPATRDIKYVHADLDDTMYAVGYFDGPTEIGTAGTHSYTLTTEYAFEPGYKYIDTDKPCVFVAKLEPSPIGYKVMWSTILSGHEFEHQSIKSLLNEQNELVVSVRADDILDATGTPGGIMIKKYSTTDGQETYSKTIHGVDVNCTDMMLLDDGRYVMSMNHAWGVTIDDTNFGPVPPPPTASPTPTPTPTPTTDPRYITSSVKLESKLTSTEQYTNSIESQQPLNLPVYAASIWFNPTTITAQMLINGLKKINAADGKVGAGFGLSDTNGIRWTDGVLGSNHTTMSIAGDVATHIPANTWNHLLVNYVSAGYTTLDGTATTTGEGYQIYLNGTRIDQTIDPAADQNYAYGLLSTSSNFCVGREDLRANMYAYDGLVAEPAIFEASLSTDQIAAIYNNGCPGDLAPYSPSLWWRTDSIVNSRVVNSSSATTSLSGYDGLLMTHHKNTGADITSNTNSPTLVNDVPICATPATTYQSSTSTGATRTPGAYLSNLPPGDVGGTYVIFDSSMNVETYRTSTGTCDRLAVNYVERELLVYGTHDGDVQITSPSSRQATVTASKNNLTYITTHDL